MIASYLYRLSRSIFTWRQPLTKRPSFVGTPVSDLFVWRKSNDWNTFFELIDLHALFVENNQVVNRFVNIIFFDLNGRKILNKRVNLYPNKRQTLDIGNLVGECKEEFGTFAVFHSDIPSVINDFESHLAERGYVSYLYKNSPLRSYVHGNFDAVSLSSNGQFEFLGGCGFFSRVFFLQHQLNGPASYEMTFVNPIDKISKFDFHLVNCLNGEIVLSRSIRLKPGGSVLLNYEVDEFEKFRIEINSKLVMARPLVFRIEKSKLDVFHG